MQGNERTVLRKSASSSVSKEAMEDFVNRIVGESVDGLWPGSVVDSCFF